MNRQEAIEYLKNLERSVAYEFLGSPAERSSSEAEFVVALAALGVTAEEILVTMEP